MQSSYATKLIDLIESKAENIAKQWAADVMKHNRTPSYHSLPKDLVIEQGINFYRLFGKCPWRTFLMKKPKIFPGNMRKNSTSKNTPA